MATELENALRVILNEKEEKIIAENIRNGVQIFDITGNLDPGAISITDYNTCVNKAKSIIGDNNIIPVLNGLILDLEANEKSISNLNEMIWKDFISSKDILISNGEIDTDGTIIFNGTSTEFDTTISQSSLVSEYTIILRFKPSDWKNYRGIFGLHRGYETNKGLCGLQYVDGNISYGHMSYNNDILFDPEEFPINEWNTLSLICNINSEARAYINGELKYSKSNFGVLKPLNNLIVGKAFEDSDRYFKGNISHFIVYNRALSESEIISINNYIGGVK